VLQASQKSKLNINKNAERRASEAKKTEGSDNEDETNEETATSAAVLSPGNLESLHEEK
jgi:hypothetical protein